jgi:DNA-binding CsgD family transcriptional regulator
MTLAPTPVQSVMSALPQLYSLTSLEAFPLHVARIVSSVIACDKADYTEVDRASGDFRVLVWPEPPQLRGLDEARASVMGQHPVMPHFLHGEGVDARTISDFWSSTEYHRTSLYGEFFQPLAVEDQLTVPVTPYGARRVAAISLDRDSRSFTDDERDILDLLHPHLVQAHANAIGLTERLAGPDDGASARLSRLSDRELEVLGHLARGLTNGAIGEVLCISVGTVRKHVEHLLERLEVPNRTAAAIVYARSSERPAVPWTAQLEQMTG